MASSHPVRSLSVCFMFSTWYLTSLSVSTIVLILSRLNDKALTFTMFYLVNLIIEHLPFMTDTDHVLNKGLDVRIL